MKNFHLLVIGCQQNEFEASRLSYILKSCGFHETSEKEADFIIVLACAVRQTAVDRIFGKIRLWPDKLIIVTGCVIERDRKKLEKSGVKFLNGENYKELAEILGIEEGRVLNSINSSSNQSLFVPIMTGCNNFCTYCAVPYTRGREKSRPLTDVIKDVSSIINKEGFEAGSEIMLLGQNVNSYKFGFADLLKKLNDLSGDFKISFISNHPKDMTDEIIDAVAKLPKIKKEIHLPLQSGSNKILKAMNRPYTREQYLNLVNKIRRANSDIELTTDVIVGFPNETEKDFLQTADVMRQVGYKMAYLNKYSPRFGTAAYALGDPISWREKQRRWHILDQILKKTMH